MLANVGRLRWRANRKGHLVPHCIIARTAELTGAVLVLLCRQRRPVIEQVARELCHPVGGLDGIEQVEGHRIVELLESTPLAPVQPDPDAPESSASSAATVSNVGRTPSSSSMHIDFVSLAEHRESSQLLATRTALLCNV